jgi:hypothetical protein
MMRLLAVLMLIGGVAQAAPVKFSDALQAKFHHERCLACHQFNSAKNNGRNFNSHRSRYLCSKCHTPQIIGQKETTWMAPDAKFDYTGFDARSTCEMAKRNLGNDPNRIREHLLHDGRVRWAIESGMTPSRQKAAVPGGYAEWERDVLTWVSGGMRCE